MANESEYDSVGQQWIDKFGVAARINWPGAVMAVTIPNGSHPRIDEWEKHNLAIINAPPMTHYGTLSLRRELEAAHMQDVAVDGINPWHGIEWGAASRIRYLIGGAPNKPFPLPRALRERPGNMIFGAGRKR